MSIWPMSADLRKVASVSSIAMCVSITVGRFTRLAGSVMPCMLKM